MNRLSVRHLVVFVFILALGITLCDAQTSGDRGPKPSGKGLSGLFSGKKSGGKIKAPKKAGAVKKEQERKDKKLKADYAKSVKESQKRTYKIQTPDVQNRMKQDKKAITQREKVKKKKTSASTRKAGRKYK
jgi:hypothetical protein